jgi:hypothetical protein
VGSLGAYFLSMRHARQVIAEWRDEYNQERPHSSLGYLTPSSFADRFLLDSVQRLRWDSHHWMYHVLSSGAGLRPVSHRKMACFAMRRPPKKRQKNGRTADHDRPRDYAWPAVLLWHTRSAVCFFDNLSDGLSIEEKTSNLTGS